MVAIIFFLPDSFSILRKSYYVYKKKCNRNLCTFNFNKSLQPINELPPYYVYNVAKSITNIIIKYKTFNKL